MLCVLPAAWLYSMLKFNDSYVDNGYITLKKQNSYVSYYIEIQSMEMETQSVLEAFAQI